MKLIDSIVKQYGDRRLLTIFVLGMSSGFPLVIIGSALSAWLKDEGFTRSAIGYFGAVFFAYSINFLWAPLIDRLKLPILNRLLGQRRSWIILTQSLIVCACIGISQFDIHDSMMMIAAMALIISFASSSQDIAIDALRIDLFKPNEVDKISGAAAMATSGWWTGYAALGSIPLIVSDLSGWDWSDVYKLTAVLMCCLMLPVFWLMEPKSNREEAQNALQDAYEKKLQSKGDIGQVHWIQHSLAWLLVTVVEPIKEFFTRNGFKLSITILIFILIFKLGESFLGRMSIVFYKEIGFSNTDIAVYSKMITWWVTVLFSLVGGWVTARLGIVKGLVFAAIAMASSNLLFALMAIVGPDLELFIVTIIVDGFTAAWGTVAFVAFISLLCSHTFSATQYALMASIGTLGRTFVASFSGVLIDDVLGGDWVLFFLITVIMIIPALLLLMKIAKDIRRIAEEKANS